MGHGRHVTATNMPLPTPPAPPTPDYNVTGTLVPDATGDYYLGGVLNGKNYYRRLDNAWFIWWDGLNTWAITKVLGATPLDYWTRTDPLIVGAYTNNPEATGTATVAAGPI